jgi:hypothetical protein
MKTAEIFSRDSAGQEMRKGSKVEHTRPEIQGTGTVRTVFIGSSRVRVEWADGTCSTPEAKDLIVTTP